jgi:L-lactate dehydrogenase complex protein LldG
MVGPALSTKEQSTKQQILERVRSAIGPREPVAPVAREYRQQAPADLEQFEERLRDYNAGVYRCAESDLPRTISEAMAARNKRCLLIPPGVPEAWLPPACQFVKDSGFSHTDIDAMEGVLTGCTAAISFTGSIVLTHGPREGRRALTLIPDYHLCVIFANQVVETVPEGIRALRDLRTRPITTIAGPSATADIEMIRVKGVHGPRTLDVILVE